jgi:exonuclease III
MSPTPHRDGTRESITFVSWNWYVVTTNRDHLKLDLLDRLDADVCALQEVGPESITAIRDRWPGAQVVAGLELAEVNRHTDEEPVRHGCAIVVRNGWDVVGSGPVPFRATGGDDPDGSTPQAGSVVWADLRSPTGSTLHVVSVHAPHASGRTKLDRRRRIARKLRTYEAVEEWVRNRPSTVLGIDGNIWIDQCQDLYGDHRAVDGPQYAADSFFHEGVERHGLQDTFRVWLSRHPEELERIRSRRPDGPLAVTFVRGQSRRFGQRIDAVMASADLDVADVEHSYEDGIVAGSDHSFVRVELVLAPST